MAPAVPTDDYYAILEVSQTATLGEITKSWRRLARKVHPDRTGANANTTEACALINNAYDTLKNSTSRRDYDRIWPGIVASMQGGAGAAKVAAAAKAAAEGERAKQAQEREKARAEDSRRRAAESGKPKVDKNRAEHEPHKTETQSKPLPTRRNYDDLLNLTKADLHTRNKRTDGDIFELNRQIRRLKGEIRKLDDENDSQNKNSQDNSSTNTGRKSWGAWSPSFFFSSPDNDNSEAKKESERSKLNQSHSRRIKEHELQNLQERLGTLEDELRAINQRIDAMKASTQRSQSSKPKPQVPPPKSNPPPKSAPQPQSSSSSDTKTQSQRNESFRYDDFEKWRQKQEEARKKQEQQHRENEVKKRAQEQKRWQEEMKRKQEQERQAQEAQKRAAEQQKQQDAENLAKQFFERVLREAPESVPRLFAHVESERQRGVPWTDILFTLQLLEQHMILEATQRAAAERKRQEEQRVRAEAERKRQEEQRVRAEAEKKRQEEELQEWAKVKALEEIFRRYQPAPVMGSGIPPFRSLAKGSCEHDLTGQACFCHRNNPSYREERPTATPFIGQSMPFRPQARESCAHDLRGEACFCQRDGLSYDEQRSTWSIPGTMNMGGGSPPSWQDKDDKCTGPACLCHEGFAKCG